MMMRERVMVIMLFFCSLAWDLTTACWSPSYADSVTLYEHSGFKGKRLEIEVGRNNEDNIQSLGGTGVHDEVSSVKWELSDGIFVVLYEHSDGNGKALILRGRGADRSVHDNDLGDKVSAWKWFGRGPANHVYVYEHKNFGGKRYEILEVTRKSRGMLFSLGGTGVHDKMSSVRYHLEPGVKVIFYEHNDGTGRSYRLPPSSSGGVGWNHDLHARGFADCASTWKWDYWSE